MNDSLPSFLQTDRGTEDDSEDCAPRENTSAAPFRKILVANRGEIAVRIIRACQRMGIPTVAVYSEPDRDCLHAQLADEAVCIGPGPAAASYLNVPNLISTAAICRADAIHPGYGFLSESASFADICRLSGLHFIGPSTAVIARMGDKAAARETMRKAGIPVLPGTAQPVSLSDSRLLDQARSVGYPLIVKACNGGGGKGIRIVEGEEELLSAVQLAQLESKAAFGSDLVYLERYLESPRHIEVQLVADDSGKVVALPERECSVQWRHQKLIEESPSPAVDEPLRRGIMWAAQHAAETVGYATVGTVEFLLDASGEFYFLEMNTRIQVEHGVTEMLTGIDLVQEQIRLAAGEKISYGSEDFPMLGHAIECRINCQDPDQGFRPSPGVVSELILPDGPHVRVDTHLYPGYTIPPFYDSLLAKLLVLGRTRQEAIGRMQRCLSESAIGGVATTLSLQAEILQEEAFVRGDTTTTFMARYLARRNTGE